MSIQISAFTWVPPVAQGLVRDLRVRWALEEAGLGYEERQLSWAKTRPQNISSCSRSDKFRLTRRRA